MYSRKFEAPTKKSTLQLAIIAGDLDALKNELAKGVNLEETCDQSSDYHHNRYLTPLALALIYHHVPIVELLLSAGASLIQKTISPYFDADLLYMHDVRPNYPNKKNIITEKKERLRKAIIENDMPTVVQFAKQNTQWFEIPIFETEKSQRWEEKNPRQTTALHLAAESDQPEILNFIAEQLAAKYGTSIRKILETCGPNQCAPLHFAIYRNAIHSVEYLLKHQGKIILWSLRDQV